MRDIKFRAWLKDKEAMAQVTKIDFVAKTYEVSYPSQDGKEFYYATYDFDDENIIIMESTGTKDKNGKEIYEGDIVRGIDWSANSPYEIDKVEYWPDCGAYSIHDLDDIEVLGNVYENPELLEAKK